MRALRAIAFRAMGVGLVGYGLGLAAGARHLWLAESPILALLCGASGAVLVLWGIVVAVTGLRTMAGMGQAPRSVVPLGSPRRTRSRAIGAGIAMIAVSAVLLLQLVVGTTHTMVPFYAPLFAGVGLFGAGLSQLADPRAVL